MASDGVRDPHAAGPESNRAKAYSRIKLAIGIASSLVSFGLLIGLVATGVTRVLATWCTDRIGNQYLALIAFAAGMGALQSAFTLPLSWYASYHVEHVYGLSNQSGSRWLSERVKGLAVSAPLVLCVLCILYFSLRSFGAQWWIPVGCALVLLTVLLTWVAPLVIMPIFYRFTPIDEGPLKQRIALLCEKAGMHFNGIFSFNLSKNTKKANAGFTGIGRSKR
ncbi:MAG TPA: M48 family peptidase, partial [Bacteroidota bacterium]|nr:M48 family peptidase [Bacteroidota bacterium]